MKSDFLAKLMRLENHPEAALVCLHFQIYYTFPSLHLPADGSTPSFPQKF